MLLEGSCHCQAIRFRCESHHPYPFNLCYCSICRKTAGGGGFAINIRAEMDGFEVLQGQEHLRVYRAKVERDGEEVLSEGRRHFCGICGSALWLVDPRWPDHFNPHASAIDTLLPAPPERTHLMLGSKASWVKPDIGPDDRTYDRYPEESTKQWHERLGLVVD